MKFSNRRCLLEKELALVLMWKKKNSFLLFKLVHTCLICRNSQWASIRHPMHRECAFTCAALYKCTMARYPVMRGLENCTGLSVFANKMNHYLHVLLCCSPWNRLRKSFARERSNKVSCISSCTVWGTSGEILNWTAHCTVATRFLRAKNEIQVARGRYPPSSIFFEPLNSFPLSVFNLLRPKVSTVGSWPRK